MEKSWWDELREEREKLGCQICKKCGKEFYVAFKSDKCSDCIWDEIQYGSEEEEEEK